MYDSFLRNLTSLKLARIYYRCLSENFVSQNEHPERKENTDHILFHDILLLIFIFMNKISFIGISILAATGIGLIGSNLSAASWINNTWYTHVMGQKNTLAMTSSLSGKVSSEALTALTSLMDKHKTAMDALRGRSWSQSEFQTMQQQFQSEMDALMVKYPELKESFSQMGKWMMRGMGKGRGHGWMGNHERRTIISSLPSDAQSQIQTIHTTYQTQMQTLRDKRKSEVDAVLAKYPDAKTKLDALEAKRSQNKSKIFGMK